MDHHHLFPLYGHQPAILMFLFNAVCAADVILLLENKIMNIFPSIMAVERERKAEKSILNYAGCVRANCWRCVSVCSYKVE